MYIPSCKFLACHRMWSIRVLNILLCGTRQYTTSFPFSYFYTQKNLYGSDIIVSVVMGCEDRKTESCKSNSSFLCKKMKASWSKTTNTSWWASTPQSRSSIFRICSWLEVYMEPTSWIEDRQAGTSTNDYR